jgi:signal transduction histidine kinase
MRFIVPHHELLSNVDGAVHVKIDKLRMEQVFSNLIGNAAKYSKKNTVIQINCYSDEGAFIRISVEDKGIGMSPENAASVFDKFYRATDVIKTHSGLGMGLYISSKIITDHGGKIWVESEAGSGSIFYFTIPVAT